MRTDVPSLLPERPLLDKKLCSCITSQCMDGKLWKIEMRFFREAQTTIFWARPPPLLRSLLEIRSQVSNCTSTEKWKRDCLVCTQNHVTPCLCRSVMLKSISLFAVAAFFAQRRTHTHTHHRTDPYRNLLKRTPLHSSWRSSVLVTQDQDPPVHLPGGVVHWHPSPFCSILALKTKEWPLELRKIP